MNEELRAAFARLDRALQDARAACAAAGVPCPEEEKPTVSFFINYPPESWVLGAVTDISVSPDGDTVVTGTKLDGSACTFCTTLTPERIRAACARKGVPCPEGEKPETVRCSGWTWTRISAVTVRARPNGTLNTTITGVANSGSGKEFDLDAARTTPAQVVRLCELAGWPKPQVRMVLTYADGSACEVDPADIQNAEYDAAFHATRVQMRNEYMYLAHYVREPVAVVEAMRDACKEGE